MVLEETCDMSSETGSSEQGTLTHRYIVQQEGQLVQKNTFWCLAGLIPRLVCVATAGQLVGHAVLRENSE